MPDVTPSRHPLACPTGDVDIDATRQDVAALSTNADNLWQRLDTIWAWIMLLQRLGVDMSPFLPVLDRLEVRNIEATPPDALRAVDDAFELLADMHAQAAADQAALLTSIDPLAHAAKPGALDINIESARDWPGYAGDPQHTASTDAPGPMRGKLAWRFATGLAWYVKPAVEGARVYAVSPGIRNMLWCLDLETGKVIWKTVRRRTRRAGPHSHTMPQSYTTPGAASTPHLLNDSIVFAEMGAQGKEQGLRHLVWIDRATGEPVNKVAIGYADYRIGFARLAGTSRHLVHTDGIQRIEPNPPQQIGHNRVLCRHARTGELAWDFPVGLTFGNPAIDEQRTYIGTQDGVLFALNLMGASEDDHFGYSDEQRIAWQFTAGGAINGTVGVTDDRVLFGANDGVVYCLDKSTGEVKWRCETGIDEPRAFQLFATPTLADDLVFIGTATRRLLCIDAATGELLWHHEVGDWIRAAPLVSDHHAYIATLDGKLHCFDVDRNGASERWQQQLGDFGIFADPVLAGGKLLATDASLRLHCINADTGEMLWQHRLLQHARIGGREVQSDEMACGGFHQSKPTAADGMIFVGSPCRFLYAIDAKTGRERWRFEMGAAISGAPAFERNPRGQSSVFIGQHGGENDFYCIDAANGLPRWKQALGWIWSSATVRDGKVFTPGVDGYLSCLDADTGQILWRYRTGRAAHPEAPIDDGRVFFGSWDHFVYAFQADTGQLLWKFHTGGSPDSGAPIAHAGRLYVPMGGKRLCCLNPATGDILWEIRPEQGCMNASPALHGDNLYISTSVRSGAIPPVSEVRCLDAKTGKTRWAAPGGGITAPCIAAGRVYFASTSGPFFTCVDAAGNGDGTTKQIWRVPMEGRVYESVPAIYAGLACILNEDGYLYAFA